MPRFWPLTFRSSFQIAIVATVVALEGCATFLARAERDSALKQAPRWYLNLPDETGFYLATGSAESPLMGAAIDIATAVARTALSQRIRAEVEGRIIDQLREEHRESSAEAAQDLVRQYTSGFEIRTRQVLYGARIRERKVVAGPYGYIAWVLVELPMEPIRGAAAAQAAEQMSRSADGLSKAFWEDFERKLRRP